jgi:DNA polymerase-1
MAFTNQAPPERAGLPFAEIWMADFEFVVGAGERPRPVCMVAEEYWTGRQIRLWEHELASLDAAPFNIGPNAAFVAYFASAEFGCFKALGWTLPTNTLDLFCEHRVLTSGTQLPHGNSLIGAARRYGVDTIAATEKETMRELIMAGGPWTQAERADILEYCASDVALLRPLLESIAPDLNVTHQRLGHAVWRGRYMGAVATMEHNGIPVDAKTLGVLYERWLDIQDALIADVDKDYGVYDGRTFKADRFAVFLAENNIPWPRLDSGRLALDDGTFRSRARSYPQVSALRELRHALGELRLNSLAVGPDGRNRTLLSPFRSKTSRNQPSNAKAIFGAATWIRGLIKPEPGTALAYLDFSSQEFAIAACLSGDERMWQAYNSGDPYLQFAKDAGLAPQDATKDSHGDVRDKCKTIVLGVQYGMSAYGMAHRAGILVAEARELLQLHHEHYRTFWNWADANVETVLAGGTNSTPMGWQFRHGHGTVANPRSILNWPMQSTGADILRLSCVRLMDAGVKICARVHDAILFEAPLDRLDEHVALTNDIMVQVCRDLLGGRPYRWMRAVGLPEYGEEST